MPRSKYDIKEVLDNGIELLRLQGYNATGINDLLRTSGIPKGSFYNFFANKQDFGIQAIHQYSTTMLNYMDAYFTDTSKTPMERLKSFYTMVRDVNEGEAFQKGCLMCNLATELGATEPEIAEIIEAEYQRWIEKISACVAEGQALGEITQTFSATEIASYLNNSYAGALVRMKASRSSIPLDTLINIGFAGISA